MTPEQNKLFKKWQWRTIIGAMFGYVLFYFVRKNFSFAIPGLTAEYGITKTSFGIIMTIAGLVYGVSKLVNGMIADRANARWHMVTGLSISTITNILFGFGAIICVYFWGDELNAAGVPAFVGPMVVFFAVLYVINQIFQGCGFPPCSRLLAHWVPPQELSTKQSVWNTSHSIGAFLIAALCGVIMGTMGEDKSADPKEYQTIVKNSAGTTIKMETDQATIFLEEVEQHLLASGMDSTAARAFRDTTDLHIAKASYKEARFEDGKVVVGTELKAQKKDIKSAEDAQSFVTERVSHVGAWQWAFWIPAFIALIGTIALIFILRDTPKSVGLPEIEVEKKTDAAKTETPAEEEDYKSFVKRRVWKNPVIWALAAADFFVYIVRVGVLDWGPTFLQEQCGLTPGEAAWGVILFELMGIAGTLLAGKISDALFGGRAQRTCVFCMVGVVLFIGIFLMLPSGTNSIVQLVVLACAGFFIYGPQALLGVIATNQATKRAASTANGFVGFVSYLSGLVTGVGFGFAADNWGWTSVFYVMIGAAALGIITLMLIWNTGRDAYDKA